MYGRQRKPLRSLHDEEVPDDGRLLVEAQGHGFHAGDVLRTIRSSDGTCPRETRRQVHRP